MDDFPPLPERGILRKGVLYRVSVPRQPKRELPQEVVETIRRVEAAKIREYMEKRKKRLSEGESTSP